MNKYIDAEKFIERERKSVEDDFFAEKLFKKNDEMISLRAIVESFILDVEDEPPADVEPVRHGFWKFSDAGLIPFYHCSKCKNINIAFQFNFCSNCGAKMDLENVNK